MVYILTGFAILLSLLSFLIARKKVSKRLLDELRSRNAMLQQQLDDIQEALRNLDKRYFTGTDDVRASVGNDLASGEITALKTEIGDIKRNLQINSREVSILAGEVKAIQEIYSKLQNAAPVSSHDLAQQAAYPLELDRFTNSGDSPINLGSFVGTEFTEPVSITEGLSAGEPLAPKSSEPFERVSQQYQEALDRNDRQALRHMQLKELNITSESEDLLLKGTSSQPTKLEVVTGGGSYMVVGGEGRFWLFPTAQTLHSFSMNQPQKGIFRYEREILSRPIVRRPAEVREQDTYWIIVTQGVISIPG